MLDMRCPFCKQVVGDENAALHGCEKCVEKWLHEHNVDHPVG